MILRWLAFAEYHRTDIPGALAVSNIDAITGVVSGTDVILDAGEYVEWLLDAGTAGTFRLDFTNSAPVLATLDGVAVGEPDPLLLPVATTAQRWNTAAYGALNVPGLSAGASYLDPTSGARVHKITSATYPATSSGWKHDYAEGGQEISLPHTGNTRTILVRRNDEAGWYLVDFTPGATPALSNARILSGTFVPFMDLAFTFSNNPATPYYAYVSNGSTVRRFDVRTMTQADGNGWPVTGETSAMWIHGNKDDSAFVWMRGASGAGGAVHYTPATGIKLTKPSALGPVDTVSGTLNEPKMERDGRYVLLNLNESNKGIIWDAQTDTLTRGLHASDGPYGPSPYYWPQTAHVGSLCGGWVGVQYDTNNPGTFGFLPVAPATPYGEWLSSVEAGSSAASLTSAGHANGGWVQPSTPIGDQWAVANNYYGQAATYALAGGGPVLLTRNGRRRLLCHHYSTDGGYPYAAAKFSPDGRFVMFTSNMNVAAGRTDIFLAEVPLG